MTDSVQEHFSKLHLGNIPDAHFAQQLEDQLRVLHGTRIQESAPITLPVRSGWFVRIAAAAAGLMLVAASFLTIPSLRSFAQDVFGDLFPRNNQNEVTMTLPANPPSVNIAPVKNIEDVQALVDFQIKQPSEPIPGYTFTEVGYTPSRNAVNLMYESPGRYLLITQQPVGNLDAGMLTDVIGIGIGPDAVIEEVEFDGLIGQYVQGAWIVEESTTDTETDTITSNAVWDPTVSSRTFRWIQGEIAYEIKAMGGSEDNRFIGKSEIIAIAQSMG